MHENARFGLLTYRVQCVELNALEGVTSQDKRVEAYAEYALLASSRRGSEGERRAPTFVDVCLDACCGLRCMYVCTIVYALRKKKGSPVQSSSVAPCSADPPMRLLVSLYKQMVLRMY